MEQDKLPARKSQPSIMMYRPLLVSWYSHAIGLAARAASIHHEEAVTRTVASSLGPQPRGDRYSADKSSTDNGDHRHRLEELSEHAAVNERIFGKASCRRARRAGFLVVELLMGQQNDLARHAALKYLSDMQVCQTTTSTTKYDLDSRGEAYCTMPSVGAAKGAVGHPHTVPAAC